VDKKLRWKYTSSRFLALSSASSFALYFGFLDQNELRRLEDYRRKAYSEEFRQMSARAAFSAKKAVR
jgi:hypothetical protein